MSKNKKITIITIIIIIILLGIMLFIGYNNKLKKVNDIIIGKPEIDISSNQNKEIYNKIENLPKNYSIINAINDKCVVSVHNLKIYNKDILDKFLENVKQNKKDFIRTVNYTIEGDPIITDISFEGDNTFVTTIDSTRDKFGIGNYTNYTFKKLNIEETTDGTDIVLTASINGEKIDAYIIGFNSNTKIINNYKNDYLLEINNGNEKNTKKITVDELDKKYNYDIFYYGVDKVNIKIGDNKVDLKEALKDNMISMDEIINQAKKDEEMGIISAEIYQDGGSKEYFYYSYKIIKRHSIYMDSNGKTQYIEDVYIGIPEMNINDVD